MKTTRNIFILLSIAISQLAFSQDYYPPTNYVMDAPQDYTAMNEQIVKCVTYLNGLDPKHKSQVKDDNIKFLREWIIGTSDVDVEVSAYLVGLVDRNEVLVSVFINGWVKHAIQNQGVPKDDFSHHVAAMNEVLDYYIQFENKLTKDPDVKSVLKKREKNGLELWLRRQLG